jgi:multiple antibiotic resistance protein
MAGMLAVDQSVKGFDTLKVGDSVGEGAITVITRIMGLILAVIGVQMVIEGVHGAIHLFK